MEQENILQNHAHMASQVIEFVFLQLNIIQQNFTRINIIKPCNETDDRRFTGTGSTYDRNRLAGTHFKADSFQNFLFIVIGKMDILEFYASVKMIFANLTVIRQGIIFIHNSQNSFGTYNPTLDIIETVGNRPQRPDKH